MQSVTGCNLKSVAATLAGYQRFKFKDKTYPGIIENKACFVEGMLYQDLDEQTLSLLDHFESVLYERCLLNVVVNQMESEKAFAYVVKDEYRSLLSEEEWDLGEFKRKHLKLYLRDISEF
ncbi:MAG TPA: gamma-glutamylcyclotransferase [Thiotrichaceae bacterium]|jgi:gamma-glutamylcyclotransferase (GGCT)/AIG2-like uncharacterized protein YtfP|nr:gamma-glutamylcyclotransferase [Thiotrichaceae bacterium]HIM07600.1 gamma-glutamylcyclotransferase [Gammaproteobacteria bacterium]